MVEVLTLRNNAPEGEDAVCVLSGKEIIGIFTTKNEAKKVAKMALLKAGAINKF